MLKSRTVFLTIFSVAAISVVGQSTKRSPKKPAPKPATTPIATSIPQPTPQITVEPPKRNGRPDTDTKPTTQKAAIATHFYKFTRPGFVYHTVSIEHDDRGIGQITFSKMGFDESVTDPISLSAATVDGLERTFAELNFLDSTENYQYPDHDFSNLGNVEIRISRDGRSRTIKYNWSTIKPAKFLMDEYRRISNEFIWKFEISVARENQPLETPRLMETLDVYFKANDLSDPPHLVPFLNELSADERMPLIARNHAKRIAEEINKQAAKQK